ncbi:MAG: glycoside hydrolase [Tannerellaceae bacterium]|nr:glycoside hydrolase [Tannerellaceae bacterium]
MKQNSVWRSVLATSLRIGEAPASREAGASRYWTIVGRSLRSTGEYRQHFKIFFIFHFSFFILSACSNQTRKTSALVESYPGILDIRYTPNAESRCRGWFTDAGAWYGFTLPDADKWVNGFCGSFHLDRREWLTKSILQVRFADETQEDEYTPEEVNYYPGRLSIKSRSGKGEITQQLCFIDHTTALLSCQSSRQEKLHFYGKIDKEEIQCETEKNKIIYTWPDGEGVALVFGREAGIVVSGEQYEALSGTPGKAWVVISFFEEDTRTQVLQKAQKISASPELYRKESADRRNNYLQQVLRDDTPEDFNRIAVKSVITLISNWQSARRDLLHDGVIPSHAVGYFMGFWGWDSWKHAVVLARFAPELAKDQVRTMFDYQTPEGMIIDCIYSDASENNERNSKPPLAAWAVHEIFRHTQDTAFIRELFPRMVHYYDWWFMYRDHDQNGICEFGACDGTHEAAAWESGMDNAIRFDDAVMVANSEGAWSLNQESVDLNAFLLLEHRLLSELAQIAGMDFNRPDRSEKVLTHFYDPEQGFFFDKRLDGTFVMEEGTEASIPLWAGLATQEQADAVVQKFIDPEKFATYIPFSTIAADNPKFMPAGYWRGPIWLDQVYFGISGMRKYGYKQQADVFTEQVFLRLQGLTEDAPIHENYDTHTGGRLKAPHFSWSAAHLLMLYEEYKK